MMNVFEDELCEYCQDLVCKGCDGVWQPSKIPQLSPDESDYILPKLDLLHWDKTKETKNEYLKSLFHHLSKTQFKEELPDLPIVGETYTTLIRSTAAFYYIEPISIKIHDVLLDPRNIEHLHYAMLHEMVHYYLHIKGLSDDNNPHDALFNETAKKVGACLDQSEAEDQLGRIIGLERPVWEKEYLLLKKNNIKI